MWEEEGRGRGGEGRKGKYFFEAYKGKVQRVEEEDEPLACGLMKRVSQLVGRRRSVCVWGGWDGWEDG